MPARRLRAAGTILRSRGSGGVAVGAYAMETLLFIKVSRDVAEMMLAHKLSTEQIV
jgi:hypothetical protein